MLGFLQNYDAFWLFTLESSFNSLLLTLNSTLYHLMHGSQLKIMTKTQGVLTYIGRFILVMVVDI